MNGRTEAAGEGGEALFPGLSERPLPPRLFTGLEMALAAAVLIIGLASYTVVTSGQAPAQGLSPSAVTTLLVVNLVPLMALLVLIARRIAILLANRRAGLAGANLHVRLVALFAALAAVPTILVVVFASLLFQFGVQFWFSDRARTVLDNADRVAQAYVADNKDRILQDIVAMGRDISGYARDFGVKSQSFGDGLVFQVQARDLSEAVVFDMAGGAPRVLAGVDAAGPTLGERLAGARPETLSPGEARAFGTAPDRIEAIVRLPGPDRLYVFASRKVEPRVLEQVARTEAAISDYRSLTERSRILQLRFNLILLFVSLLIVAIAIWLALWLATRLVDPLRHLASAAERVGAGDFDVKVDAGRGGEEVSMLARAFNRMTGQIKGQQTALRAATAQAENRRRFIEAVLSGVSAGVLSVGEDGTVRLANRSATLILDLAEEGLTGRALAEAVPEFETLFDKARQDGTAAGEILRKLPSATQTLAVRLAADPGEGRGYILTFDDISEQLADQRRAAWSDVARRIAHEIKNPLTPIVLSAERLQRRFAGQVTDGRDTFDALTATIIRQVDDLRRMVDEFSAFARMPGPSFREENLTEIARQAIFLAEVAAPGVRFRLSTEGQIPPFVCDRRQLGQAFTNLLKNAIEAIQSCGKPVDGEEEVSVVLKGQGSRISVTITDSGCGVPDDLRERLFEPYVTTRPRGTGLGLAIVKRIIEDHRGRLDLQTGNGSRPGRPGAIVRLDFDADATRELLAQPEDSAAGRNREVMTH
jgi:two-component system nitrogen regulation sensor histidine kinase NtrY